MLRRCFRFAAMLALSVLLLPIALWSRVLGLLGAERRALRRAAFVQGLWARGILRVLGVELELEGTPPGGASVLVANHLSYLDIPVLAAHFSGCFVAKTDIAGWPFFGPLATVVGTIFLDQKRRRDMVRVEREMVRTLSAGVPVVLFAEGHSTRGLGVDRLHGSLLECAVRGRVPCLAVALSYETPRDPWAPAATVCWWGGMSFWRHAWTLVGLRGIVARVRFAPAPRSGTDRKSLAEELRQDLLERFVPVRQGPIAPDYPWPELFAGAPETAG